MLILVNAAALSWCGFNYATLSSVSTQDAIYKINKMSDLANQSLRTMNTYSAEYKQRNVNKICQILRISMNMPAVLQLCHHCIA